MYLCSDTKRYLLVELQQTIHTLGDLRLLRNRKLRNRKLRWTDSAKDNVAEERSSLYLSDRKEEKTHLTRRVDKELLFFYDPAISERQQRHPKRRIESP
jgi:predicted  nucleic acid-binding Zn-ribbon protein